MRHSNADVQIDCKAFPSRGWQIVQKLAPVVARAAYFGHYDILVVHFDCDDGPIEGDGSRRSEISRAIDSVLSALPEAHRQRPVESVLCSPCEATDAWLMWGQQGGNGMSWERMPRKTLKEELYGNPPRRMRERAAGYAPALISRMTSSDQWPQTLKMLSDDWMTAVARCSA
jgi:hypothetical protein